MMSLFMTIAVHVIGSLNSFVTTSTIILPFRQDSEKKTVLHHAIENGHNGIINMLLGCPGKIDR